jgi:class 3 adenylate cyclase
VRSERKQKESIWGIAALAILLAIIFAGYFILISSHQHFRNGEYISLQGKWQRTFKDDYRNTHGPTGGAGAEWQQVDLKPGDKIHGPSDFSNMWIYRKILLPPDFIKHRPGLILGRIQFCDETFVNGVLVGRTGSADRKQASGNSGWNTYRHYEIPPQILHAGENEISIRIVYGIYTPVFKDSIGLASGKAFYSSRLFWSLILDYLYIAFSSALFVIGLMFFVTYWQRRKDAIFLYYSQVCFLYGSYIGMFYAQHLFGAGPEVNRFFYMLPPWCAWCLFNLVTEIFLIPRSGFRFLFWILLTSSVIINLALPLRLIIFGSMFTHTAAFIIFVLCLLISIGAMRRNSHNAGYAAVGFFLILLSSIFDNLFYYFIPSSIFTFPITTLYLIGFVGIWFTRRTVKAMREIEDLNINLEQIVEDRTEELRLEKVKTDELIRNILPDEIVEELKSSGKAAPRRFQDATIMFADIVGFTRVAEQMDPELLVSWLDEIFRKFDSISENYALEKLKTIGDCYMAACGLPRPVKDHAIRAVTAAFEMLDAIKKFQPCVNYETSRESFFQMRFGIHSGPVVAGIVGHKKFAYDIWGDNVNIAARLEATGAPGRINISRETAELIKASFLCIPRGFIEIKNRGMIEMFWVDKTDE